VLKISDEVRRTVAHGGPVVALETALVTHGLPAPRGLDTARAAEDAVREAGAVPATVGVLGGAVVVGLSGEELGLLAAEGSSCAKAGARDLAALVARGRLGSTTVSGTLAAARKVGIRVAATGGIGGVHRGWSQVPDISADLRELAASGVALVSSGFKSILDLRATLEALEALGVPVVGLDCDRLPGFYARLSTHPLEHQVQGPAGAARLLRAHWTALDRSEGLLLAHPPPAETALPNDEVEGAVEAATQEARRLGIGGKALSPFLLKRIVAQLGDRALEANTALIVSNARMAGSIAAAFAAGP
jgi:pseudouridine-5'-phosphate glycosidase